MTSKKKENKSEEILFVFDDSKIFELVDKLRSGKITKEEYREEMKKN